MPSTKKTLHFLSCALVSVLGAALLGFGMSANWSKMTFNCTGVPVPGSAVVTLSIFTGSALRDGCPNYKQSDSFSVIPQLSKTGGAPVVLHGLITGLCVICLIFSALSILIALYNSVSNPYETYMGPIGIYVCSASSTILSAVIICMHIANVLGTGMMEGVVRTLPNSGDSLVLNRRSAEMKVGFCMLIPYLVLSLSAIALIYTYQHAAYTHKREQHKPTMDEPKEIMMY